MAAGDGSVSDPDTGDGRVRAENQVIEAVVGLQSREKSIEVGRADVKGRRAAIIEMVRNALQEFGQADAPRFVIHARHIGIIEKATVDPGLPGVADNRTADVEGSEIIDRRARTFQSLARERPVGGHAFQYHGLLSLDQLVDRKFLR